MFGIGGTDDMRHDARTEMWTPMEIRGASGYFNDLRIDRASLPEWFRFWELADEDSDGTPCRYKSGILGNFYGTFLTTGELPFDYPEWTERIIDSDGEWDSQVREAFLLRKWCGMK